MHQAGAARGSATHDPEGEPAAQGPGLWQRRTVAQGMGRKLNVNSDRLISSVATAPRLRIMRLLRRVGCRIEIQFLRQGLA
ncbi:hypothetical protein MPLSOD_40527 [Mesorhizobium sp. SOD10]|nr:hypothetical protein MPLSOD_40527 [Mesorhizobium sp. SOD10]